MHKFIPLAVFVVIAIFLGIGLTLDPGEVPSPLIDKPTPEFSLPRLKEPDTVISSTDFRNDVTLFNVWASWCVACRTEHPVLMNLASNGNVRIFGLNYKDDREDALQWLQRHGDPYDRVAYDREGKVGIDFGVYGVPETFVIDKNGIIRYKHIGPISDQDLENTILPLVARLQQGPAS